MTLTKSLDAQSASKIPSSQIPAAAGLLTTLVFVALVFTWFRSTSLASISTFTGLVEANSSARTINSADGGTILSVKVKEGDVVRKGDVILTLDSLAIREELGSIEHAMREDEATSERISVELSRKSFATDRRMARSGDGLPPAQKELLRTRQQLQIATQQAYGTEVIDVEQNVKALEQEALSLKTARLGAEQDLHTISQLYKTGDAPASHYNQQLRQVADLQMQEIDLRDKVREARSKRTMLYLALLKSEATEREAQQSQVIDLKRDWEGLQRRSCVLKTALSHMEVRAPFEGEVNRIMHKGVGELVAPGTSVAEIVPRLEKTVVIVHVDPRAVSDVRVGQSVQIRLFGPSGDHRGRLVAFVSRIGAGLEQEKDSPVSFIPVALEVRDDGTESSIALKRVGTMLQAVFAHRNPSLMDSVFQTDRRA